MTRVAVIGAGPAGLAESEIHATGMIGDAEIVDGHVERVRRCYPVYSRGYKEPLARLVSYLNEFQGLTAISRYGAFK
jgi:protoporphyrinogen oxidase